ncbi:polysaccharide pyruvyl transferase family protein [Psychromonas sp.]|uniref:polysaccharide pyruvyl transferase family protein n=1 Tax=Psychromonas sp. TaxID=1884585 RepID=UPI003A9858AF
MKLTLEPSSWHNELNTLKGMHNEIYKLIGDASVAYVDIPFHFNVGDLLIYKGTEQFFKEYNIKVNYRCFSLNCSLKSIESCDVIVMHGGGNFGDIYSEHQSLREKLISKFPNKRIRGLA